MNDDAVYIKPKTVEPLKIKNNVFKSAYDWELIGKDFEKAARELGETEERKKECLIKLKEKLSATDNPSVKYRQDDVYLLRFLRVRKYDIKKAYQNIRTFFEQRKKHPEFFTIPPDLKSVQQLNWITILPYTDEEERIIFLLNFNKWNLEERSFEEMMQATMNTYDVISMNPKCQINGVIGLWNFDGLSMRYVSELLWNNRLWTLLSIIQNGYPWRIKMGILLNTNRFVRFLYNMMKPLLQRKVTQRCVLLGSDLQELHQHVNPVLLPKTLGGSLEEEECDISQYILDNLSYLRYERSFSFG